MKKKKIKLIHRGSSLSEKPFFRFQSKDGEGIVGNCAFIFNPLDKDYDWLVIIDDISKTIPNRVEELSCPKENTIFITTEPSSITYYGKAFVKQFHYLITNQDEKSLPHPNAIRSHTGNVWFYGKDLNTILNEDSFLKTKKISTVCSNKQQGHTMHKLRYEFTKLMQEKIPELERYGKGFNWIETKAEALDSFEFHVAIENHVATNVWTEKLADAFLGLTVPIYCGCPNVYDYFPKDSLIQIDINDFEASIKKIKEIINTPGEYERRLPAVKEARRRVIEEYNLFEMINKVVENSNSYSFTPNQKIYNRRIMRLKYLPDFFRFANWKINNFFRSLRN